MLETLWQRVLAEFVRRGWLEADAASAMFACSHAGLAAYVGPPVAEREALPRMASYLARAPLAGSRLRFDTECADVGPVADRVDGRYAGVHRMAARVFLARWGAHADAAGN